MVKKEVMLKKKKDILENLKNTYCRLKNSGIHGIGVFAIRDIAQGTNPFQGCTLQKWAGYKPSELKGLDKEVLRMIDDFYASKKDGTVFIPECGLNGMDISFFLNTSNVPNLKTDKRGDVFFTVRRIKKGEELTVNYGLFDEKYTE